tara:strand:- start:1261 stop:2187 length:927 start_codon:yes stop_codon:yes gene_type:complete
MNKINLKYIIIIIIFILFPENTLYSKIKLEIIFKINNEIITNIDLANEKKFLLFLNPKLNNLSSKQIENISKDSIINRKIKEIELTKYFQINKEGLGRNYVNNFVSNSSFNNIDNLKTKLSEFNLNYHYFEENFKIDNLWREFIFNKFKSQIKINTNDLKKQIKSQNNELEELNLSEILFEVKVNENFNELKNKIYTEINKSGFEAAASIFSISDSKNFGGKLGWVKSNQISKTIYSKIKNIDKISQPIKINNKYLILKINEKRKSKDQINLEEELKKLIDVETKKEINKLGYIYFNKVKKRIFISEN